jgi:outer membrane protein assembly factor BamB
LRASRSSGPSRRSLAAASVTLALVLVVGVPLVALADWSQFQGGASHQGVTDGPSAPLEQAWSNDDIELDDAAVTGSLSSPVVADDGTVVVVGPNEVLGFDGENGSEVFSVERDLGPSVQPAIGRAPGGQIVVFTEGFGGVGPTTTASPSPSPGAEGDDEGFDSHVNAVDLATGEPVWGSPVQLEALVRTPVAADERAAYVGDVDGRVTAIELTSGEVRWTADLGTPTAGAVTLDGGRAYVATVGGQQTPGIVVALDTSTGDEVWRSEEEAVLANLVSTPIVADGRILALEPGFVVTLDARDGRLLWRTEIVNPQTTPFAPQGIATLAPVSSDGQAFVVDVTGRVFALDAETGAELWDHAINDPSQLSPPLLSAEHVLVPTDSGMLYAIDRRTGHLVFQADAGGAFLRGLADAGILLIGVTGAEDARVVAFGHDPDGSLVDEPSPTTVDVGRMLVGFALGALPAGIVAMALARPLQRRLGTTPRPQGDLEEDG